MRATAEIIKLLSLHWVLVWVWGEISKPDIWKLQIIWVVCYVCIYYNYMSATIKNILMSDHHTKLEHDDEEMLTDLIWSLYGVLLCAVYKSL